MNIWKKVFKKTAAAFLALSLTVGSGTVPLLEPQAVMAASYTYTYYPRCRSSVKSFVTGLQQIGVNSSYSNRNQIAKLNGYNNYRGTASQNNSLLWLLKNGKLVKSKTENERPIADGIYMIQSGNSDDRVLDINNWNMDNCGNLETYYKNDTTNQRYQVTYVGNGYYKIIAVHSGRAIDVAGGSTASGTNVQQYEWNGTDAQLWKFEYAGNGYYYIHSKLGKYLDNSNGSTEPGNNVIVYDFNGTAAQKWKFVVSNGSKIVPPVDNTVQLSVPSYKQYDSRWGSTKIGTKTIKSIGCLLTSLSMKYSYHTGRNVYPNEMKGKLSFSNNDLLWYSVTNLGYSYSDNYNSCITNSIMTTIYNKLKDGKPVIIGGKKSNGGTHWVVVTGYTGSGNGSFKASDFQINDPNAARTTLAQFTSTYPTVLRLIW